MRSAIFVTLGDSSRASLVVHPNATLDASSYAGWIATRTGDPMTDTLVGTLVPIAFFLFLAAIILTKPVLRSRERQALLKVAQVALEKGQPWPPELLDSLKFQDTPPTAVADLRKGAVLLAVAAAMALLFVTLPAYELLGAAAFPALLGLVYIGFGIAGRKTPKA